MHLSHSSLESQTGLAPTWVRWRMLALLVAFSFMTWFNRVSMSVAYDEQIKTELDISEEAIGWVYSTFLFAYMLCMTPGGWFIDRFGPRLALVAMGFGSGLFGALTGLAGFPPLVAAGLVLPTLFVVRFIMGMLSAPVYPGASRAVSFWFPPGRRSLANGFVQSGAAFGIAFAFHLFGTLIDHIGWPAGFLVSGSVTALLALIWTLYAADHPAQHPGVNKAELQCIGAAATEFVPTGDFHDPDIIPPSSITPTSWLHLFRNRSLVFLTISYGALGYLEYLFFFWMHYYFDDVLHLGKEVSRTYSMVLFLAFAAGMIAGGWLTDRIESALGHSKGRGVVPILGMLAGGIFLWVGLLVHEVDWIVICLASAMAGAGACEAVFWPTAVDLGGRHGGTAAGIFNTGGNLGGLIAPVLTPLASHMVMALGGVSEQVGWQWGIALGGLICLSGAVLWLWIDVGRRQA
jgi:ACS family D-galactonate transporter-like MFS transporter